MLKLAREPPPVKYPAAFVVVRFQGAKENLPSSTCCAMQHVSMAVGQVLIDQVPHLGEGLELHPVGMVKGARQ